MSRKQAPAHDQSRAFKRIMTQARTHMNPVARIWSIVIHIRVLDLLASAIGSSLGRPLALLCGAIGTIAAIALLYGTAKIMGYSVSGFEGAAGFLAGWVIGLIIDFIRAMVSGGRRAR